MPSNPLDWIEPELASLEADGLRRRLAERAGAQGLIMKLGGAELVNFGSNDYLGLASDERLLRATRGSAQGQARW
jgi:8-amino-7-oxononanoate synthase